MSIATRLLVVAALVIVPFTAVGGFPTPESALAFTMSPAPPRPIPVPAVVRASRTEGLVILEVLVARDGLVRDAKLLRSHPMFDQAALDAVRQWRYTPTTLNGTPVDVTMTVTLRFSLN